MTNYAHEIPIRRQLSDTLPQLWGLDAAPPALHHLHGWPGMTREDWANVLCALGIMLVGLAIAARWWLA